MLQWEGGSREGVDRDKGIVKLIFMIGAHFVIGGLLPTF